MAKHKRARKDLSGADAALSHNPFAALAQMSGKVPANSSRDDVVLPDSAPLTPLKKSPPTDDKQTWFVQKTRKGAWDLHLEKRAGGKLVTRLSRVSGDAAQLLKLCKKHCGSGGRLCADGLELQGDQRDALRAFLQKHRGLC